MLLLKNARIYTMEYDEFIDGDILIENGKIKGIGKGITASTDKIIDIRQNLVFPGFIDARSHIGLVEDGMGFEGNDMDEVVNPVTPELCPTDGINIFDKSFADAVKCGVTACAVEPGSANVLGGEVSVIKTYGKEIKNMTLKSPVAISVNLGEPPKRANYEKVELPMSRMGEGYLLRNALTRAKNYMLKKHVDVHSFDASCEALIPVIKKKIPLKVRANRAQDMIFAVNIAEEFDIDLIIDGCAEGQRIIDLLKYKKIPVMLGPYLTDSSNSELFERTPDFACTCLKENIPFSIVSNHPDVPVQFFRLNAACSVKSGLSEMDAIKAITINPAKALGVDDRIGSLKEGKDADVVVLDGSPFKIKTNVLMTIVNGVIAYNAFEN